MSQKSQNFTHISSWIMIVVLFCFSVTEINSTVLCFFHQLGVSKISNANDSRAPYIPCAVDPREFSRAQDNDEPKVLNSSLSLRQTN